MTSIRTTRIQALLSAGALVLGVGAGPVVAATLDHAAAPGANYDVAEFRLWYPDDAETLRGVVLLVLHDQG